MKTITEYTEKLKSFFLPSREIAPVEDANVSSAKYPVGKQFIRDSRLCRAKTTISAGDTFVLNSNYELSSDVSSQIQALSNQKADNSDIAKVEGNTFSKQYTSGQTFYHDGVYYEAKTTIPQGTAWSSLTLDVEYKIATPVSEQISNLTENAIGSAFQSITFPFTAPTNGFIIFKNSILSSGTWYDYYSITGMTGQGGWIPQFCGSGATNNTDVKVFPIHKGATIDYEASDNVSHVARLFLPMF